MILCGFPGIGKTYITKFHRNVSDSDSSMFSWISPGKRHPEFPVNYIKHLTKQANSSSIVLASSHRAVRDALVERDIYFTLAYPVAEAKEVYLDRYKARGNDQAFIQFIAENWDDYIQQCYEQEGCDHLVLKPNEYLLDRLPVDPSYAILFAKWIGAEKMAAYRKMQLRGK